MTKSSTQKSTGHQELEPLRIAAVGDIHVKGGPDHSYHAFFSQVSAEADILILCGDLTDLGLPHQAESLAKDMSGCSIPVIGVLGNHDYHSDKVDEIREILREGKLILLDEQPFEYKGVGFAGVKGFGGGFDNHVQGAFGEDIMKHFVAESIDQALQLENSLHTLTTKRKVAVLHYSPVSHTVMGEPREIFSFLGCSRLAEVIDHFDVSAVFHGHAHNGTYEGRTMKGTPVFNCAYEIMRKRNADKPYALIEV